MAETSLHDFSSFLNRPFWPGLFPIEPNGKLHNLYAVSSCLGNSLRSGIQGEKLPDQSAGELKGVVNRRAKSVHALVRHEADPQPLVSTGVVVCC